jgi:hypothetical protein
MSKGKSKQVATVSAVPPVGSSCALKLNSHIILPLLKCEGREV